MAPALAPKVVAIAFPAAWLGVPARAPTENIFLLMAPSSSSSRQLQLSEISSKIRTERKDRPGSQGNQEGEVEVWRKWSS